MVQQARKGLALSLGHSGPSKQRSRVSDPSGPCGPDPASAGSCHCWEQGRLENPACFTSQLRKMPLDGFQIWFLK